MNFFEWVVFASTTILANLGVDFGPPPTAGPEAETVNLLRYNSDGDFDFKGRGEWILIDTGEYLQVMRNRIRPKREMIENDRNFLSRTSPILPWAEPMPLLLDRKQGVACLGKTCAIVYAICPPSSKMAVGEKCRTFDHK